MTDKKIAIVIPAKDEEASIARCIESVFVALDGIRNYEIILIDSFSSDRTVEIAKKYPIRILRLQKHWPKSPHAGRYLGAINSDSKYIFYLDADMAVHKDWIKKALNTLERSEKLGGVTGVLYNVSPGNKPDDGKPLIKNIGYRDYLPGAAIFRNDVLKKVKHFNPFFVGYGEKEIGYRISENGFKQLKMNEIIAYHFKKKSNLKEVKEKSRYFIGVGQFIRLHFNLKNVVAISKQYPLLLISYCYFLLFSALFVLSIIQKDVVFVAIPISISILFLLALVLKQRNLKRTAFLIFSVSSSPINFIRGLLKKTATSEEYPTNAEIIQ
jgi:glycosyltransferase involved in cell wall biosynthesis